MVYTTSEAIKYDDITVAGDNVVGIECSLCCIINGYPFRRAMSIIRSYFLVE